MPDLEPDERRERPMADGGRDRRRAACEPRDGQAVDIQGQAAGDARWSAQAADPPVRPRSMLELARATAGGALDPPRRPDPRYRDRPPVAPVNRAAVDGGYPRTSRRSERDARRSSSNSSERTSSGRPPRTQARILHPIPAFPHRVRAFARACEREAERSARRQASKDSGGPLARSPLHGPLPRAASRAAIGRDPPACGRSSIGPCSGLASRWRGGSCTPSRSNTATSPRSCTRSRICCSARHPIPRRTNDHSDQVRKSVRNS